MLDRPGAQALATAGLALVGFLLVFVGSSRFGPIDSGTYALAACGATLVFALRRLFALVRALSRPDTLAQVGRGAGQFSLGELRDERRRLLRAIKELEFDFGMGKLSQQDYDAVIGTYRLRAIEVMRALEGDGDLHPELQRLFAERTTAAPEPAPAPGPAPATAIPAVSFEETARICAACNGNNESDAKFCKHCGANLSRKGGGAPPPQQNLPTTAAGEIGA